MEIIQSMEKTPNNQKAQGNINSTITQINGDYIAMDEGKMTDLCLKLVNDKLQQLREDAHEVLKAQVASFSNELFQRIAKMEGKVETLEKFANPAIQLALGESLMGYSQRCSDEHKTLLIDSLLERLQVDDISTKAILLDKIRKGIPNLTQSQVDMLAFLVFKCLTFECKDITDLKVVFKNIDILMDSILKMTSLDFYYLQHTDFVHKFSFASGADFIEKDLLERYKYLLEDKSWNSLLTILKEVNPLWPDLFNSIKNNDMACFMPTAQGFYLGLIRLSKVLDQKINYDILLDKI